MEEPPCLPAPQIGNIGNVAIDTQSRYFHFTDLKPYERFVPSDNFGVMYPDPIIPSPKFDLPANFTKGVYLTFRAPKGAKPGVYEGQIRLSADGKVLKTLPYKIRVYGFSLSDEPQVYAIFDIRLSSGAKYKNYTHREAAKYLKSKKLSSDTVPARISFKLENGKPGRRLQKVRRRGRILSERAQIPLPLPAVQGGNFRLGEAARAVPRRKPLPGRMALQFRRPFRPQSQIPRIPRRKPASDSRAFGGKGMDGSFHVLHLRRALSPAREDIESR